MTAFPDLDRTTGLERARRRVEGLAPLSPVHATFGLRVTEVERGSARTRCGVPPWLRGEAGLPPGLAAVVADTALGTALLTTLPPGWASVTRQLRLDHLAPITGEPDEITAVGQVEDAAGPMPLVVGTIYSDGLRIATASARCLPVPGHGEQVTESPVADPVIASSLSELLAAVPERTPDGVRVRCSAPPAFANVFGALHGGTVVLLGEQGLEAALADRGIAASLADLHVTYVRPVPADGSTIMVEAAVLRASRRVADVEAHLIVEAGLAVSVRAAYLRASS